MFLLNLFIAILKFRVSKNNYQKIAIKRLPVQLTSRILLTVIWCSVKISKFYIMFFNTFIQNSSVSLLLLLIVWKVETKKMYARNYFNMRFFKENFIDASWFFLYFKGKRVLSKCRLNYYLSIYLYTWHWRVHAYHQDHWLSHPARLGSLSIYISFYLSIYLTLAGTCLSSGSLALSSSKACTSVGDRHANKSR